MSSSNNIPHIYSPFAEFVSASDWNAYFSSINPATTTYTYNLDGTLDVVTDSYGTKTFTYNLDGTLASITGTGIYRNISFTYNLDGTLAQKDIT